RSLVMFGILFLAAAPTAACGGSAKVPTSGGGASTQGVFESVAPSIVAVLNDDQKLREEESKQVLKELGVVQHAPKTIVDVSLRKEPTPHGTGFLIDGGV